MSFRRLETLPVWLTCVHSRCLSNSHWMNEWWNEEELEFRSGPRSPLHLLFSFVQTVGQHELIEELAPVMWLLSTSFVIWEMGTPLLAKPAPRVVGDARSWWVAKPTDDQNWMCLAWWGTHCSCLRTKPLLLRAVQPDLLPPLWVTHTASRALPLHPQPSKGLIL